MFPLPITTWLKLGAGLALAIFFWYSGYSFEASRFERYKAEQVQQTIVKEHAYQANAAKIEKEKNDEINNISAQLLDAVSELRKRPSRTTKTSDKSCGTGATLSAEDAEFLIREAARADKIRSGLEACYKQYDAVSK